MAGMFDRADFCELCHRAHMLRRKPLCEFLGHQAPDRPFPSGNTTPEFQAFAKRRTKVRTRKSIRNILILLGLIAGGSMAWIWRSRLSEIISKMRHLLKEQTYLARR